MEDQKLVVNFPNALNVPEEVRIVFLTGDAQEHLPHPISTKMASTMEGLVEFVKVKGYPENPKENKEVVTYSKLPNKKTIILISDPQIERNDTIVAELKLNPDLVAFGMNSGKQFRHESLLKFVRQYAHCFADLQSAKDLVKALQNFEVKFEQTIAREDDRKGDKKDLVESAIKFSKGEIPLKWDLFMPLYLGTPKVAFSFEIEIDKQDSQPVFSFYSMEIEVQTKEMADTYIDDAIRQLKKYFVCVETV